MKIKSLFDTTFENKWHGNARAEVERRNINYWVQNLPVKTVEALTLVHVDQLIRQQLNKGLKPSTINSKIQTLKTALDYGYERELHAKVLKLPRLKQRNDARVGFFSEELQKKIESLITDDNFRQFFIWSCDTGLRPSESLGLSREMVRFDKKIGSIIDVTKTKNGESRAVPLTDRALDAITAVGDWSRFTGYHITRQWARLRRLDPELSKYVFYHCRHTCATRLVSCGVNIKVVQQWMGHKDIAMTLRYAKLVPADLASARDRLQLHTQQS